MSAPISKIAAVCAVAAIAAPAALALPESEPLVARVTVAECSRGPEAEDRFGVFRGVMRRVARGDSMAMRFVLQERRGDRDPETVHAPGLGVWQKSAAGVKWFVYRQRVTALAEGSDYRARVQFRWYDPAGRVVREAVRASRVCRQPGDLANLRVTRIRAHRLAGSPGVTRYALKVVNRGDATAPSGAVELSVDGAKVDTAIVGGLEPGEGRVAFVNGPDCAGSVRAEADPADSVIESDESDNGLALRCPLR